MSFRLPCLTILTLFVALAGGSTLAQSAGGRPQPASAATAVRKPVSLPHLYRAYLLYQSFLDDQAAVRDKQGKDGAWTRSHLQARMGFSDAEFAPVRASSQRLAAETKALDAKAKALRAIGSSSVIDAQLKQLVAQREAALDAEIASLKQSLPPDRITAFESFLMSFFSSRGGAQPPSAQTSQSAPAAVQQ